MLLAIRLDLFLVSRLLKPFEARKVYKGNPENRDLKVILACRVLKGPKVFKAYRA